MPMAGRRERLRQRVLGRQRACKLSACATMTDRTSCRRCDSFRARTTRCHRIPHKCAARDGAVYIATCRHPRAEACPCLCRRNKGASPTFSNKQKISRHHAFDAAGAPCPPAHHLTPERVACSLLLVWPTRRIQNASASSQTGLAKSRDGKSDLLRFERCKLCRQRVAFASVELGVR